MWQAAKGSCVQPTLTSISILQQVGAELHAVLVAVVPRQTSLEAAEPVSYDFPLIDGLTLLQQFWAVRKSALAAD